jgi:hypothetical protein
MPGLDPLSPPMTIHGGELRVLQVLRKLRVERSRSPPQGRFRVGAIMEGERVFLNVSDRTGSGDG